MARQKPHAEDIKPADGFTPAPEFGAEPEPVAPEVKSEEPAEAELRAENERLRRQIEALDEEGAAKERAALDHPLRDDPALKDAVTAADEIARLRAENAALKAARGPDYASGRKYRVSIKDGPTAVVECEGGEHPFEAFKRATGVLNSVHAPEIHEAPDGAELGIVKPGT